MIASKKNILEHTLNSDANCKKGDANCVRRSTGPTQVERITYAHKDAEKVMILDAEIWEPCYCKPSANTQIMHLPSLSWITKNNWNKPIIMILITILLISKKLLLRK